VIALSVPKRILTIIERKKHLFEEPERWRSHLHASAWLLLYLN